MADLLKVSDIARELGRSEPTVYRQVKGLTPAYKTGRTRYYERAILNKLQGPKPQQRMALDFSETGSTNTPRFGGSIQEEKIRELRGYEGLQLLREMRLNDPIISAVFFAVENLIRRVTWRVSPASESIADLAAADFLESAFGDMSFDFDSTLQFILQMLESGFSVLEVVWKKRLGDSPPTYVRDPATSLHNDGRIGWRKWAPRPAESLARGNEWTFDENGGIQGINQLINNRPVFIPIERLLLFRTTVAPSNSPSGRPIHRPAYLPWYYSNQIQEIEGIGIERDMVGLPVVYLGNNTIKTGDNNDFETAKDLVVNLRWDEQAGVVIPYPKLGTAAEGEGMLLELLSSGGRHQYDINRVLERIDKRKAIVMLGQFIMLGMEQVGSFALSVTQSDLFSMAVSAWLQSIAGIINRHAVPKLFRYNVFPGITGYPQWVPSDVSLPSLRDLGQYVNMLAQASVIKPDAELERHLRHIAKLPPPSRVSSEPSPSEISATPEQIMDASHASIMANRMMRMVQSGQISSEIAQPIIDEAIREMQSALGLPSKSDLREELAKQRRPEFEETLSWLDNVSPPWVAEG